MNRRSTRSNTDLPDFSVSSPVASPDTAAALSRRSNSGSGRQPAPRPAKVKAVYVGPRKVRSSARAPVQRRRYSPDVEASRPQLAGGAAAGNDDVDMDLNEDEQSVPAVLNEAAPKVKRSHKKVDGTGGKKDKKKKQRTAKAAAEQKDDFDDEPITAKVCPESLTVQLAGDAELTRATALAGQRLPAHRRQGHRQAPHHLHEV